MSSKQNPTLKSRRIRIGLTLGDPSGIGPAIILKALERLRGQADFTVIASARVLNKSNPAVFKKLNVRIADLDNVSKKNFKFGETRGEYGKASIEYLDIALELLKLKEIDCLVTGPISKEAINLAGFKYSGHTEYLSKKTNTPFVAMLLLNQSLKFSLVTRHIALKDVAKSLTKQDIFKNILLANKGLKELFGIKKPRIVVCGLNPHASDNGVMGDEEKRIITPVLEELKKHESIDLTGPVSSDVAVSKMAKSEYDCVIAMYHDQALIPLKLSGAESGVNFTLGLPFIRTSPLHGTAFDLAGNFHLADPSSLIAAIKSAIYCARNMKK